MKINIRYQVSETYEEIYEFRLKYHCISYECIWESRRANNEDIWGYDWSKYYHNQKKKEIADLQKEYEIEDVEDFFSAMLYLNTGHNDEFKKKYEAIDRKYMATCNNINGKTRLCGTSSGQLWENHPPAMPKDELKAEIRKQIIEKTDKMIDKL